MSLLECLNGSISIDASLNLQSEGLEKSLKEIPLLNRLERSLLQESFLLQKRLLPLK